MNARDALMSILCAVCMLSASRVRAESERPAVLRWGSDTPCAAPDDLDARIAALGAQQHADHYSAHVTSSGHGYRLTLRNQADEPVRVVELASCEEARETAILLAAMGAHGHAEQPDEVADEASEQALVPWRVGVAAGALSEWGPLPNAAFGGIASAHVERGWFRLSLSARYDASRTQDDLPSGAHAKLDLLAFTPATCALLELAKMTVGGCAELALGRVRTRAFGVEEARSQRALWLDVGAAGVVAYAIAPRVVLQLTLHAAAVLRRPRFALHDAPPFHEVSPFSLRAAMQLLFWFGPTD